MGIAAVWPRSTCHAAAAAAAAPAAAVLVTNADCGTNSAAASVAPVAALRAALAATAVLVSAPTATHEYPLSPFCPSLATLPSDAPPRLACALPPWPSTPGLVCWGCNRLLPSTNTFFSRPQRRNAQRRPPACRACSADNADRAEWRRARRQRCTGGQGLHNLDPADVAKIETFLDADEEELCARRHSVTSALPPPPPDAWNTRHMPARPPLPWQADAAVVLCVLDMLAAVERITNAPIQPLITALRNAYHCPVALTPACGPCTQVYMRDSRSTTITELHKRHAPATAHPLPCTHSRPVLCCRGGLRLPNLPLRWKYSGSHADARRVVDTDCLISLETLSAGSTPSHSFSWYHYGPSLLTPLVPPTTTPADFVLYAGPGQADGASDDEHYDRDDYDDY